MSAESEDYEIMPHKELINLKEELKKLKSKGGQKASKADMDTVETLNASIQELLTLFKEASKDMKTEEGEEAQILHKLTDAIDMMNTIVDQNEKIAEGIVTVAEMIKDHFEKHPEPRQPIEEGTVLGVPVLGADQRPARQFQPPPQQLPAQFQQQQPQMQFPPQQPIQQPLMGHSLPQKSPPPQFAFPEPAAQPQQDPFQMPAGSSPFPDNPFSAKPEPMESMPPPPAPPPPPPGMATSVQPQRSGFLSRFK